MNDQSNERSIERTINRTNEQIDLSFSKHHFGCKICRNTEPHGIDSVPTFKNGPS